MTSALVFDVYSVDPPGDSLTFLATLDDAFAKSYRPELNGTGSGQFTINRSSANATAAILGDGTEVIRLVKVRMPSVQVDPVGCFFLEKGDFTLISPDEAGGEDLTFGGRGGPGYWDRPIWLPTTFTLPWWPACLTGGPTAGARGAVDVAAGTYRAYTVAGGVITGFSDFVTPGFCASFDTRQTYQWPSKNNKRFLVHLLDGPQTGIYFHPHQAGVKEYLASLATGTGVTSTVKLGDVGATPGAVLRYLYDEATDAGRTAQPIPLMTVDFDATTDSDGNAWTTTDALAGLSANVGDTYLQTVGQLLGTGVIDVVTGPDLDQHAYNHYGRDLTGAFGPGVVRFERAVNIVERLARHFDDRVVGTFAVIGGTDDSFAEVSLPDAASRVAREIFVNADSNVDATLQAVGLAGLNLRLLRGETVEFPIAVGADEAAGRYTPGPPGSSGHFWIGDLVTLFTGSEEPDFAEQAVRVTAMTLEEDDAGDLTAIVNVRTGPLAGTGTLAPLDPNASVQVVDGDPFFTDGGSDGSVSVVRFRPPWSSISAEQGVFGDTDAYIDLQATPGTPGDSKIDIFAYNFGGDYAELIFDNGVLRAIASKLWEADVDGTGDDAKHYLIGGWGLVFDSALGDADPAPGASQAGQIYYNITDNVFRWYNGAVWADFGGGGGGIVVSDDTPLVESGAGDPGTSPDASRSDHVHPEDAGGGSDFTDDAGFASTIGGSDALRHTSATSAIGQEDLGGSGGEAYLDLYGGQALLHADASPTSTIHAEVSLNVSGQLDLFTWEDGGGYSEITLLIDSMIIDANAGIVSVNGRSITLPHAASAPGTPAEGETYYDDTLHVVRTWDGSAWVSGGGSVTPATDPGDIADPTIATPESNALKLNALMGAMRTAGLLA